MICVEICIYIYQLYSHVIYTYYGGENLHFVLELEKLSSCA